MNLYEKRTIKQWRELILSLDGASFWYFADYYHFMLNGQHHRVVCCSWMELHTDTPTYTEREWTIRVMYQANGTAFVYTDEQGKLQCIKRFVLGEPVTFCFKRPHGLVPTHIAELLCNSQHKKHKEYKDFEKIAKHKISKNPKLIWTFD